jgi:hypothetical protein
MPLTSGASAGRDSCEGRIAATDARASTRGAQGECLWPDVVVCLPQPLVQCVGRAVIEPAQYGEGGACRPGQEAGGRACSLTHNAHSS